MQDEWCEVRALPPEATSDQEGASSVVAPGQYRCSRGGTLAVELSRAQRWKGWTTVAAQTFDAPRTEEWSPILQTPSAGCVSVQFACSVAHVHDDSSETLARTVSRPCSASG